MNANPAFAAAVAPPTAGRFGGARPARGSCAPIAASLTAILRGQLLRALALSLPKGRRRWFSTSPKNKRQRLTLKRS